MEERAVVVAHGAGGRILANEQEATRAQLFVGSLRLDPVGGFAPLLRLVFVVVRVATNVALLASKTVVVALCLLGAQNCGLLLRHSQRSLNRVAQDVAPPLPSFLSACCSCLFSPAASLATMARRQAPSPT